jgi:type IX secretion system PorP/SprF family membrane protein
MLRKSLFILTVIILSNSVAKSQDAEFSQFYANPLYLNPAMAGSEICRRAVINYRNQWPGLNNNFVTYNASYDQYVEKLHGGIGAMVMVDNIGSGILTSTQVSFMYAYGLRVSKDVYINMALQGTLFQKYLNWNLLQFEDQIDLQYGFVLNSQETPPDYTSIIFPDFDAGIVIGWKGFMYGGLALHHLMEPNTAFYVNNEDKMAMKITAHYGVNLNLDETGIIDPEPDFYISPNIIYQQQNNFHQINGGMYLVKLPLVIGAWYRHNFENADAFIVLAGISYDKLKVGYSYDITLARLKSSTGGAHEVSLAWRFNCIPKLREVFPYNAPGF